MKKIITSFIAMAMVFAGVGGYSYAKYVPDTELQVKAEETQGITSVPRSYAASADVKNPEYSQNLAIFNVATSISENGISYKMRLTENIPAKNLDAWNDTIITFAPADFDMDLFDWSVELSNERGSNYKISAIDEYGADNIDKLTVSVIYDRLGWTSDIKLGDLFTLTLTPKKEVPDNTVMTMFGADGYCTVSSDTFTVPIPEYSITDSINRLDANCDGVVDASDASIILAIYGGIMSGKQYETIDDYFNSAEP